MESIVGQLDLTPIQECYAGSGSDHYDPGVMLRISIYCILDGVVSPRKWARKVQTCLATKYVAREQKPSISAFYRFRDKARHFIDKIFQMVLKLADADGFLDDADATLDGTFNGALASRHRLVNEKTLDKRIDALKKSIEDEQDEQDEQSIRAERTPNPKWMAKTSSGRKEQMSRFRKAKEVLKKRKERNAKRQKSERLNELKILVSTSDPDVPISRDKKKVFGPLWPTQFVTHVASGLILAVSVFANPTDSGTIGPMLIKAHQNFRQIDKLYADAGYTSQVDIKTCIDLKVQLIAPVKQNSFTQAMGKRKQADGILPLYSKSDFIIDYEKMECQCPEGHVVTAKGHGSRELASGDLLKVSRAVFPILACAGCVRAPNCKPATAKSRTVRITEGEWVVEEHLRQMTPEILAHCCTVRGQTAEKAFADGKGRAGLESLGCKTLDRAEAVTTLHVMALNIKRLFTLRKNKENTA